MECQAHVHRCLGVLLFALSAGVSAQQTVFKSSCMSVGNSPPEQLAGREGQSIGVGNYTCHNMGGPLDGAVTTGVTLWHHEKGGSKLLSGSGVSRRPDAQAVWNQTEGVMRLTVTEGRVTGFTGSGRGFFQIATGAAAAWNGKSYSFKFASTGPGRFDVETVLD